MFSRDVTVHVCDRRTDRQTDGHSDDGTSCASMVSYGKNTVVFSTISPIISKTVQDTAIVTMEVVY